MARSKYRFPDRASAEKAVEAAETSAMVLGWLFLGRCKVVKWHRLDSATSYGYLASPRQVSEYLLERTDSGVRVTEYDKGVGQLRNLMFSRLNPEDSMRVARVIEGLARDQRHALSAEAA